MRITANFGHNIMGPRDWTEFIKWFAANDWSVEFDYAKGALVADKPEALPHKPQETNPKGEGE